MAPGWPPVELASVNTSFSEPLALETSINSPQHPGAGQLKNEIGHPHQQVGSKLGVSGDQSLADEDKTVIDRNQDQGDGNPDVGFAPMDADAQRDADQCEPETREGKR